MDHIIKKITDKFLDLLPGSRQYYALDDLSEWGFPDFLIRRIRVELERNLADSMQLPETDWANTETEAINRTWQQFIKVLRAEAHLPASYARTVVETAVADIVEMLVQPRNNIPEVIFGSEEELPAEAIKERLKAVVVYPHFAALLPRYMEKKNLNSLTKTRCRTILSKADEKLTARYSPLNWAQLLEPLFSLLDGKVDTNVLRLFFEDKKERRLARNFDLLDSRLNRAELIEVLSSPDSLNMEGYEDDEPELFEVEPKQESAKEEKSVSQQSAKTDSADNKIKNAPLKEQEPPIEMKEDDSVEESQDEDSPLYLYEEPEEEPEEYGLSGMFRDDNSEEEESPEVSKEENESSAKNEEKESNLQQEKVPDADQPDGNEKFVSEEETEGDLDDQPETPMWQRFMDPDEIKEREDQESEEEDFVEEPIIDLTEEEPGEDEVNELFEYLEDSRSFFVKELFQDSERAYEEAVEELVAFEDWKKASKYIHENIFKRNMIDMYSEPAVDFTDRMHSYFLKKK